MEIKVENQKMVNAVFMKYLESIASGAVPFPKCLFCQKTAGNVLGIFFHKEIGAHIVFSICTDCWKELRGEEADENVELKAEIMKKIEDKITIVTAEDISHEVLKVSPKEWMN